MKSRVGVTPYLNEPTSRSGEHVTTRRSGAGRPRDERIDAALLSATIDLLAEVGYSKLTIAAVAARAEVTAPAIYRRFASKGELVYAAVLATLPQGGLPWSDPVAWTDRFEDSVRELVVINVDLFSRPAVRGAFAGLFSEFGREPGAAGSLLGGLQGEAYAQLQRCLDHAAAVGKARSGLDSKLLLDMITGALVMSLANDRTVDDAWIDQIAHLVLNGIRA
jgi:AcrR family transcriptional regulator